MLTYLETIFQNLEVHVVVRSNFGFQPVWSKVVFSVFKVQLISTLLHEILATR